MTLPFDVSMNDQEVTNIRTSRRQKGMHLWFQMDAVSFVLYKQVGVMLTAIQLSGFRYPTH